MNAGELLLLVRDVVEKLVAMQLLNQDGNFVKPTVAQEVELAQFVEQELKKYGVPISDKVVNITGIVPLILGMVN